MYMTVYIRFILNRLGRLGIRKKNAGNTWKQGHRQKIYSYYVLYLYVIIIIKQGTKPVYIWRRGLTHFQINIYNYKATKAIYRPRWRPMRAHQHYTSTPIFIQMTLYVLLTNLFKASHFDMMPNTPIPPKSP